MLLPSLAGYGLFHLEAEAASARHLFPLGEALSLCFLEVGMIYVEFVSNRCGCLLLLDSYSAF